MAYVAPSTVTAGTSPITAAAQNIIVNDVIALRASQVNVVQAVKLDTFSTTSNSFVDVTGLSATITPTTNTSKILIFAHVNLGITLPSSGEHIGAVRLTGGNSGTFIGDAGGGSQPRAAVSISSSADFVPAWSALPVQFFYLDSPATTSATTYKIQVLQNGYATSVSPVFVNYARNDGNYVYTARTASNIVVMEIAV